MPATATPIDLRECKPGDRLELKTAAETYMVFFQRPGTSKGSPWIFGVHVSGGLSKFRAMFTRNQNHAVHMARLAKGVQVRFRAGTNKHWTTTQILGAKLNDEVIF